MVRKLKTQIWPALWLALVVLLGTIPAANAQGTTPQTSDEFFAEGNTFFRRKQYDKAVANYTESIKMRADNAYSHLMRGAAYQNKGDLEKALADYNKAIELDPNEYLAYFRRSKLYEVLNKKDLAAADDREFRRRLGDRAKPRTAEEYYDRAVYAEERGFGGDAIADYSEAIKLDPGLKKGFPFSSVYEKRGDIYVTSGKDEEALKDYTRAIEIHPQRAELYLKRADILNETGVIDGDEKSLEAALKDYTEVINRAADLKFAPEILLSAYSQRAEIYKVKNEDDKAISDYTEALKLDPKNADTFIKRANVHLSKGAYDKGIRDYDQGIILNPKSAWAYNGRGNAYRNLKEWDKAIADYNKAIELSPKYFWPYFNRGLTHNDKSEWDKAEADYTQALTIDPKHVDTLNNRGVVYIKKKEWDKALADLTQAVTLNPKDANAYNNRGVVYRNKEDWEKSIADYTQAVTLNPKYAIGYRNRAFVYRKVGKNAEADADDKKANELEPAKPAAPTPAPVGDDEDDWW